MTFSYDRTWANLVAMMRPNATILLALAGVFFFVPAFALWLFAPLPPTPADNSAIIEVLGKWYQRQLPAFVAVSVCDVFGQAAILVLLLDAARLTVAQAIARAARYLLPLLGLTLIVNLALLLGFALFILPGVYLMGRFAVAMPVMMAERRASPARAMTAAWECTRGLGWRIAGIVLMITVLGSIAVSAATSVLGVVVGLALPTDIKPITEAFVSALSNAALSLLLVVLSAAIYRELRPDPAPLKTIFS